MSNENGDPPAKASGVAILGLTSSVVALFLSLNTCVYNIVGYASKPELTFIPPEQVTLYATGPTDNQYLGIVTDFNIFNKSRPDKYGVVTGERVEFTIDGTRHVLRWQEVGKWGNNFEAKEPAHPFSVAGGALNTQEVSFLPRSKEGKELSPGEKADVNWVDWSVFLQFLDKASTLPVRCVLELQNGKSLSCDVVLDLHEGVKKYLRDPNVKWAAVRCD